VQVLQFLRESAQNNCCKIISIVVRINLFTSVISIKSVMSISDEGLFSTEVLLANGARLPRADVVPRLYLLERLSHETGRGRELLGVLRKSSLTGDAVPHGTQHELSERGVLMENGTVDPATRQVVLAAVRGEGDGLFVVTPYTSSWDRTFSDLILSRQKVRATMPPDVAELLIASRDTGEANTVRELRKWVNVVGHPENGPGSAPPSPN
jgi:hypothetical protein